jgi:hypothetical protein
MNTRVYVNGQNKGKKMELFFEQFRKRTLFGQLAVTANMAEIVVLAIAYGQSVTAKKSGQTPAPDAQKRQIMIRRFYDIFLNSSLEISCSKWAL